MRRTTALDRLTTGTDDEHEGAMPLENSLLAAVEHSVKGMPWVDMDHDRAAVTLARALGAQIDAMLMNRVAQQTDPTAVLKELRLAAPQLLAALEALGATPRARGAFAAKGDEAGAAPAADPVAEALKAAQARFGTAAA